MSSYNTLQAANTSFNFSMTAKVTKALAESGIYYSRICWNSLDSKLARKNQLSSSTKKMVSASYSTHQQMTSYAFIHIKLSTKSYAPISSNSSISRQLKALSSSTSTFESSNPTLAFHTIRLNISSVKSFKSTYQMTRLETPS